MSLSRTILMTDPILFLAMRRRRYCPPSDHLVTVVGRRRVRDGLRKRYWIRCRMCDLEHGPYDEWQDAWLDLMQGPVAAPTARRRGKRRAERELRVGRVR
jgi:hypothetical protein